MYTIVNKSNIARRPFEPHSHQQTAALYKRFIKRLVIDSLKTARSTRNKKLKPIIAIEDIIRSLTRTSEIHTHSRRIYPVSRCTVLSIQKCIVTYSRRTLDDLAYTSRCASTTVELTQHCTSGNDGRITGGMIV